MFLTALFCIEDRQIFEMQILTHILSITEKQYDDIEIIVGSKNLRERMGTAQGLIVIWK